MSATRRRTSIACDRCSRHRTRCDGGQPCQRCRDYDHACTYQRTLQKRGRPRTTHAENFRLRDRPNVNTAVPNSQFNINPHDENGALSSDDGPSRHDHSDAIHTARLSSTFSPPFARSSALNGNCDRVQDGEQLTHSDSWHVDGSHSGRTLSHDHLENVNVRGIMPLARSESNTKPHCRALTDIRPIIDDFMEFDLACDLLDMYFAEPNAAFFNVSSPFVLCPVIRRQSIMRSEQTRNMSPALVVTILWAMTHTATSSKLFRPGKRTVLLSKLQDLALSLYHDRDPDHWHRFEGLLAKKEHYDSNEKLSPRSKQNSPQVPTQNIDDLLTVILFTIITSAGDTKNDAARWLSKAIRLVKSLGLNRIDICVCVGGLSQCYPGICVHATVPAPEASLQDIESTEEGRRAFWLLFALDRHLALSWNSHVNIADDECLIFDPLPDALWLDLDKQPLPNLPDRRYGPPLAISGVGFFEYFLPLMTILGDVIATHHRAAHPRFGHLEMQTNEMVIDSLLQQCMSSLDKLAQDLQLQAHKSPHAMNLIHDAGSPNIITAHSIWSALPYGLETVDSSKEKKTLLVILYSRFIIHVLYVLLYGKWDAISLLAPDLDSPGLTHGDFLPLNHPQRSQIGEWIASQKFATCASHAISASEAVADILAADPELNFMPYLFGIYLLHGSFIVLLFADRLPNIGDGRNHSVETACETIIRAHEVSVVTLPTEFQKRFRRVLRATLYSVRQTRFAASRPEEQAELNDYGSHDQYGQNAKYTGKTQEMFNARKELFDLYRWTSGSCGLAAF